MASLGQAGRQLRPSRRKMRSSSQGDIGYDNARENIDPHVKTKALSTLEGTIQGTPTASKDIVNKEYVDSRVLWEVSGGNTQLITPDDMLIQGTNKIFFNDTDVFINSSTNGQMDLTSDGEIEIDAPIVDINASTGLDLAGANLNTDWLVNTSKKIKFRDAGIFINSSADGKLNITADGEIEITGGAIDIDAGDGEGSGSAGDSITIDAGAGGGAPNDTGGNVTIRAGSANTTSGQGGTLYLEGGDAKTDGPVIIGTGTTPDTGVTNKNDMAVGGVFNAQSEIYGTKMLLLFGDNTSRSASHYLKGVGSVQHSATQGYVMTRAGSISGISVNVNITSATAGSLRFEVFKNGAATGHLVSFSSIGGTGIKNANITQGRDTDTFSQGDLIQVFCTEGGLFVWQDMTCVVEVFYDR